MNTALDFHDSKVSQITSVGDAVVIHFDSVYLHRSFGVPGVDSGSGWCQEAELVFDGVSSPLVSEGVMGSLSEARLIAGAQSILLLPVPFRVAGDIEATFVFSNGSTLHLAVKEAHLELLGEPVYVETYPGA